MNEAMWTEDDYGHAICTNCYAEALFDEDGEFYLSNYCPNCGAEMMSESEQFDIKWGE